MFSSVNITDSRYMRRMTEVAVRDSAGKLYFFFKILDVLKTQCNIIYQLYVIEQLSYVIDRWPNSHKDETNLVLDDGFPTCYFRRCTTFFFLSLLPHIINCLIIKYFQGIFGMNVGEINPGTNGTIAQYIALTIPLTLFTAWIIMAFQSKYIFAPGTSFMKRLAWPVFLIQAMVLKKNAPPVGKLEYPIGGVSDFWRIFYGYLYFIMSGLETRT